MAALTTDDLFRLEVKMHLKADRLQKEVAAQPGASPEMRAHDERLLSDAKDYGVIGDLLGALGGDWDGLRPQLMRAAQKTREQR